LASKNFSFLPIKLHIFNFFSNLTFFLSILYQKDFLNIYYSYFQKQNFYFSFN
jgi:hypothetical protein